MASAGTTGGLDQSQVDFFKTQGYLLVEDAIPPSTFDLLKHELGCEVENVAEAARAAGKLTDTFAEAPFERRLALIEQALGYPQENFEKFNGKLRSPGMFEIVIAPALLDMVESVIGAEILAHPQFNLRAKLPDQDKFVVPWHQDEGYLQPGAEETFMVNFWVPMVDATRKNGTLEVLAGSHRAPLIEHEQGLGPAGNFKGLHEHQLPAGEQVLCEIGVGGVVLLQKRTVHRSVPNISDGIRWSLDLRYCDPAMPTGRDTVPGFLARSAATPGAVPANAADWNRICGPQPIGR
jgi:phytanoyl-CoA hydroxylase